MVIKKKGIKEHLVQPNFPDIEEAVEKVISRGGKTTADDVPDQKNREIRFTLRVPHKLLEAVDDARKSRIGTVSRNQFIVEMLNKALK